MLGGTDQKFNLLVGRALQKEYGQSPQSIVTAPLLEGTDGVEKMSKSNDNYIALTDSPGDMYGKVLSIPDTMILKYIEFCTYSTRQELDRNKEELESGGTNPRDIKRKLARDIVEVYHGSEASVDAEKSFDKLFISKDTPEDIPEIEISEPTKLIEVMVSNGMVSSNGDAKRMIKQGAVKLNDEKVEDSLTAVSPGEGLILKVGKRRFVKIL